LDVLTAREGKGGENNMNEPCKTYTFEWIDNAIEFVRVFQKRGTLTYNASTGVVTLTASPGVIAEADNMAENLD
jgi:hypothetical protein